MAVSPDDILLVLGLEFEAVTAALDDATSGEQPDTECEQQAYFSSLTELQLRLRSLETAILGQDAKTIDGLRVKARAASWARLGDLDPTGETTMDQRMALSIVRDLIRLHEPALERPGALKKLVAEMTAEQG